jgi:CRP-like cAMP-binding protein
MTDAHCAWDELSTFAKPPSICLREGSAPRNTLLASLPDGDLAAIRPHLERVVLRRRQVLQERNTAVAYAYFIERGIVSLLCRVAGRDSLDVGALGRDDVVGVSVVLGTARAPHRAVVQVTGEALRIRSDDLRQAMDRSPCLRSLLLAHVHAMLVQSEQLVACHAYHSLSERLASALMLTLQQLDGDEVPLTHRSLSRSLGVRRAGVTTMLGELEASGIIRRGRGQIRVLDRERLEHVACECQRIIRTERRQVVCENVTDAKHVQWVSAVRPAPTGRAAHQGAWARTAPFYCTPNRHALS